MRFKRLATSLVCVAAMLSLFCCTAFAASPDHGHIREQSIVSEDVTAANNENNSGASTQFFLFIENPIEIGELPDTGDYGMVLRAKGIVKCADCDKWIHFDYVPGEQNVRMGSADVTGKLCVIGSKLDEHRIAELFGV